MQVRELELRDSLGRAHEVDLGLNAQVPVLTRVRRWQGIMGVRTHIVEG